VGPLFTDNASIRARDGKASRVDALPALSLGYLLRGSMSGSSLASQFYDGHQVRSTMGLYDKVATQEPPSDLPVKGSLSPVTK